MTMGARKDIESLRSEIDRLRAEVACLRSELVTRSLPPHVTYDTDPSYWWKSQTTCKSYTYGKVA